jgi:hypothetical protein
MVEAVIRGGQVIHERSWRAHETYLRLKMLPPRARKPMLCASPTMALVQRERHGTLQISLTLIVGRDVY